MVYLREHREALGGSLPARVPIAPSLDVPPLSAFDAILKGSGERTISTTMAFVRALSTILRDKTHRARASCRSWPTSRARSAWRACSASSASSARWASSTRPEDSEQLMFYREDRKGQILQEGITEAGALSSWIAAGTSYANHGVAMIPFFIFYSMFGFQRVGDLIWAAGDSRARGFLLGGTSGRTTLNGEGLQHEDGHSHIAAATIPNCRSYDPTFGYEVAVILQDGLRRMLKDQRDVFYYLTLVNENYEQPAMPEGAERGILRGMHQIRAAGARSEGAEGPAAGLGRHPARGDGRGRPAGAGLRRPRGRLERHQLHRAAPRRHRGRPLEPPAPHRGAAGVLRRAAARPTAAVR